MKRWPILGLIFLAACLARAQDIAGDWQGTLSAGGAELRLVLHLTKAADGSLTSNNVTVEKNGVKPPM